jgi:hypothetical protein
MEKHEVVRVALALQKHGADMLFVGRHIFGEPETQSHIEIQRRPQPWCQQLNVIQPHSTAALVMLKVGDLARLDRHARTKLQRIAARVERVQGLALESDVHPLYRAGALFEELIRLNEVRVGKNAQADSQAMRRGSALAKHQRVVTGFLDAAEIQRIVRRQRQDEADDFLIKDAAGFQIFDRQRDMAGAPNVERRIQYNRW